MSRQRVFWFFSLSIASLVGILIFIGNIFAEEERIGVSQEQEHTEWITDQSNTEFLNRITLKSPTKDSSTDIKDQEKSNNDSRDSDRYEKHEPGFFGMFGGNAHKTESYDTYQFFANLFQGATSKKESDDAMAGWNFLSSEHDAETEEWWKSFHKTISGSEKFVADLFLRTGEQERKEGFLDTLRIFQEAVDTVKLHWNETFRELNFTSFDVLQFLYFMDREEEVKNPVWKRRVHRHYQSLTVQEAEKFYPALFLSYLSYTTSCAQIDKYAQRIGEESWVMRNCTMESKPHKPAHFLMVHKIVEGLPDLGVFDFLNGPLRAIASWDTLQVALVVRGTKTVGDMLTDSVLKPCDYRGGKAHDGILRAANWLVESYRDDLRRLLDESGKRKLKLWLTGHSLGAGAASLAAIEFLECCSSWIDAEAVGFGTPALLSYELSHKYRNAITTVVTDADAVPRMSGASLVNAWYRILSHDFGDDLLFEYDHLTRILQSSLLIGQSVVTNVVQDTRKWISDKIENQLRPQVALLRNSSRAELPQELIPPGECVHLYRDGTSWQGSYVNCSFFHELDVAWHALDDHLIPTGYYRGLLDFVRGKKQNVSWMFEHDLLEIPM